MNGSGLTKLTLYFFMGFILDLDCQQIISSDCLIFAQNITYMDQIAVLFC